MRSTKKIRWFSRKPAGVAAVELAVSIPILTLITLGTIEASGMIFLQQSIEVAAHEGARVALVPSTTSANVIAASNVILTGRNIQGTTVTVSPGDFANRPYGTFVKVTVTASCDQNAKFSPWFYQGQTLSAEVEMMKETD